MKLHWLPDAANDAQDAAGAAGSYTGYWQLQSCLTMQGILDAADAAAPDAGADVESKKTGSYRER